MRVKVLPTQYYKEFPGKVHDGGEEMKQYHLSDVLFMGKEKAIAVENEGNKQVGFIKKIAMPECEKGHAFSFTTNNTSIVRVGIKKRGIKDLFVPSYLIQTNDKNYRLKDKAGNNLFYFCVEGKMDEQSIRVEENWSGDVEINVNGSNYALIRSNDFTLKTTIEFVDDIRESSALFGVTLLMYFMYKIYKNESEFMEEMLFD